MSGAEHRDAPRALSTATLRPSAAPPLQHDFKRPADCVPKTANPIVNMPPSHTRSTMWSRDNVGAPSVKRAHHSGLSGITSDAARHIARRSGRLFALWLVIALNTAACSNRFTLEPLTFDGDDASPLADDADMTPDGADDAQGIDTPDQDAGPCAIDITPDVSEVFSGQSLKFEAFRDGAIIADATWRFDGDGLPSGGSLQEDGSYEAGDVADTTDRLIVQDTACAQGVEISLRVLPPPPIVPSNISIGVGQRVAFQIAGGPQENVAWRVATNNSGATIDEDDGLYTAGNTISAEGDVIEASLEDVGITLTTVVTVQNTPLTLTLPMDRLVLLMDEPYPLFVQGGSGEVLFESDDPSLDIDVVGPNAALLTLREVPPEELTLTARDAAIVDLEIDLPVGVMTRMQTPLFRNKMPSADASMVMLTAGTLDPQRFVAVGMPSASFNDTRSGAVTIIALDNGVPAPEPAQIITGRNPGAFFGQALIVADLNDDGFDELIVGAPGSLVGQDTTGAVEIWTTNPEVNALDLPRSWLNRLNDNGLNEPNQGPLKLMARVEGAQPQEHFGAAIAVAPLDDDSALDLLVTAPRYDVGDTSNVGALYAIYNDNSRFTRSEQPFTFDSTGLRRQGEKMAIADLHEGDTDGCPELLLSNWSHNQGAVRLYVMRRNNRLCELTPNAPPQVVVEFEGAEGDALGRSLALVDLTGDGVEDFIIGAPGAGNERSGNLYIVPTDADWLDTPFTETVFVAEGNSLQPLIPAGAGELGTSLSVTDANGDGHPDILTGAPLTTDDAGVVKGAAYFFQGTQGDCPQGFSRCFETASKLQPSALAPHAEFGLAVAIDEASGLLSYAERDPIILNDPSTGRGALYAFLPVPMAQDMLAITSLPNPPAGARFGDSAAFVGDFNGDTYPDMVVGAPGVDGGLTDDAQNPLIPNAGAAFLYLGTDDGGFAPNPAVRFDAVLGQRSGDGFGVAVAALGDIDGDGLTEIAVGAPGHDRNNQGYCYCGDKNGQNGAVFIYKGHELETQNDEPLRTLPHYVLCGGDRVRAFIGEELVGGANVIAEDSNGLNDLIIGAPRHEGEGAVYVVSGKSIRDRLYHTPEPTWTETKCLKGRERVLEGDVGSRLGERITTIEDLNDDGVSEFIIAAPHDNIEGAPARSGVLHIMAGCEGNDCEPDTLLARIPGTIEGEGLGQALLSADLDGDGSPELIASSGGLDSNTVRIWDGESLRGAVRMTMAGGSILEEPTLTLTDPSQRADTNFGASLAFLRNDNDTITLLIGAPGKGFQGEAQAGGIYGATFTDPSDLSAISWTIVGGEFRLPSASVGRLMSVEGEGPRWMIPVPGSEVSGAAQGEQGQIYITP